MGIIFETFKIMKIGKKKSEMSHRFLRCFHVCLFVLVLDVTTLSAQDLSRKEMRQAEKREAGPLRRGSRSHVVQAGQDGERQSDHELYFTGRIGSRATTYIQ